MTSTKSNKILPPRPRMSSDLLTTFSPQDGSCSTQTIEPVIAAPAPGLNSRPAPSTSRGRHEQACLLDALIGSCKSNCLLTYILGATLVASIFNTILLSFVIKSLQLNDRGFINGKISWDATLAATVFELPTSLEAGKSISLNSIESRADKPLNFLVRRATNKADTGSRPAMFLSTQVVGDNEKKTAKKSEDVKQQELDSQSSYMAASESLLEIGTRSLRLDLIDENNLNRWNVNNSGRNVNKSAMRHEPLLEFDDESRSIRLPRQAELRTIQSGADSILLESAGLLSDSIVGWEENLRVQTRGGNLEVDCRDALELISKSAGVKMTTLKALSLESPSVALSAAQGLYVLNGIDFFDSEPEETSAAEPEVSAKERSESRHEPELIAHDLVVVGGELRAAA